ncbi:MAG: beta-ketoacyl-[acyl-carrier-protein] synthase family protein [Elusimicrobia bacterium]|nr:beta-ketoacyl-[acyl-carrier-protein] synthase family protein [Candidatus Obscuribacterium magneticum]
MIVVSGIGIVSPLGGTREETWANLIAGRTGIVATPDGLAAPVINFSPNGARSRAGDFAITAAREALEHAGIGEPLIKSQPIGCAVSQSKPLLDSQSEIFDTSLILSSFSGWSVEAVVRRELGLSGPALNCIAACATGIASIEMGAFWIESGQCDIALVGASESSLHPLYRAGFEKMGVLAKGEGPDCARPFDRKRSGFVMGEGAAVLVLESEESCCRRGHKPIAALKAANVRHSAQDFIRFDAGGEAVSALINRTMSGTIPDYINAHGTGTVFNDVVESKAIRLSFGKEAYKIPVSSTKAATGHLLGAAGALEAALSILALRDGIIPQTLNLTDPDPACDLDYVPLRARAKELHRVLSLSYGFGGQIGAVSFERVN